MKKNSFWGQGFIALFLVFVSPLNANPLNGLWRSDRPNITIRIEQNDDGFRARRMDQGIWYRYVKEQNNEYVDRHGNWYDVLDDNEMIWHEASSSKQVYFIRQTYDHGEGQYDGENRNVPWDWNSRDRNNDRGQDDDEDDGDDDDREYNHRYPNDRNYIDGQWFDRISRQIIYIEPFQGGFRIRSQDSGWEKYYADRSGYSFRDRRGNLLQILDGNSIRWRNQNGRGTRIFTRQNDNQCNNRGHGSKNRD